MIKLLFSYCLFLGIGYGLVLVDKGYFLNPDPIGYFVGFYTGCLGGLVLFGILMTYWLEPEK